MGKRGPAGPDDDQCLKAWELHVRGANLPKIAAELKTSVSTARRWRRRGRELAAELTYSGDGELKMRALHEHARATLQEARRVLFECVDGGVVDPAAAMLAVIRSLQAEAEILGYKAPSRAAIDVNAGPRRPIGPDSIVVEATSDYHARVSRGEIEQ